MDQGLYISAAGVMASMHRMDVYANNLANVATVGFKADVPVVGQRGSAREEHGLENLPSNALLEKLTAGPRVVGNRIDLRNGSLSTTSSPLDVAIQGPGFFMVRDREGGVSLTRDGRFVRSRDGTLETISGLAVLDDRRGTITVPAGAPVRIDADGTIRQNGSEIARLGVVDVPASAGLGKGGEGLITVPEDSLRDARPAPGLVRQFHVEESGVDEITTLMALTDASRAIESNLSMIQASDRMNERLINTFARVA